MKNRLHRRAALVHAVQLLEPRQLLSYSVNTNSAVIMNTSLGEVAIQLYNDGSEPATIANFLSYVTAGTYNGTIFHRTTSNGDSNSDTFGIVQGGGFTNTNGTITPVATKAPIVNEFTDAHPDAVGTIAMARTSGQDSATSQFFFNTTDNSSIFGDSNPYAAFGNVIRGLGIVDTINNLSTTNSVTSSDGETLNPPETTNTQTPYVTINTASEEDTMTVTIGPGDAAGDRTVSFRDPTTNAGTTLSLGGANATVTFTGTNLTARRNGGNLDVSGTNLELQEIASTNTTSKTNLVFSSPGRTKTVNLGDINISGSLHSIVGTGINLTGDIAVTGSINTINLLASNAAGFISLDADDIAKAPATTIDIPFLSDISIQSGAPIQELITRSYTVNDGTSRGVSSAGAISKVLVYGAMNASVDGSTVVNFRAAEMSAFVEASGTVDSVTIGTLEGGGVFSGAAYNAKTLGIKSVKITGTMEGARILSGGNIGNISAGLMTSSAIVAGFDTTGNDTAAGGFTYALASDATLHSLNLKTPKSGKDTSFSDSEINAYQIDSLHLGRVSTALGSTYSVLGIQTVDLKSLIASTDQHQSLDLSNITSAAALQALIAQRKLTLKDFTIDVIPTSDIGVASSASG